jgi:hypothetical protein
MTGPQTLRLMGPAQVDLVGESSLHLVAGMAMDNMDRGRLQAARSSDDMPQQRPTGQRHQHLGSTRLHSLAFAGGEHNHMQRGLVHRNQPSNIGIEKKA